VTRLQLAYVVIGMLVILALVLPAVLSAR